MATFKIKYKKKSYEILIDDSDIELVGKYKWRIQQKKHCKTPYVARLAHKTINGKCRTRNIRLHRYILGLSDINVWNWDLVDHKNGNTLDNRRDNLRVVNFSQNTWNARKMKGCSSKYKGVTFDKDIRKWRAYFKIGGNLIRLGNFTDEVEAAMMYNRVAKEFAGEYARLNVFE